MPISQAPRSPGKTTTRTSSASTAVTSSSEGPRDKARREGVEGIFSVASMVTLMRGQYADAGAFSLHGPKIARETMLLGRNNEQIGKVLDLLGQAGPYTGLAFAVLPLLAQLAVNHGRIPADKASGIQGVMTPTALEAKVKGELAELELEALKDQQKAEDALNALKSQQEEGGTNGRHASGVAA